MKNQKMIDKAKKVEEQEKPIQKPIIRKWAIPTTAKPENQR